MKVIPFSKFPYALLKVLMKRNYAIELKAPKLSMDISLFSLDYGQRKRFIQGQISQKKKEEI